MGVKIEIELLEQKDGRILIVYNNIPLGYVDEVKPLLEAKKLEEMIQIRNKVKFSNKLLDGLNEEIIYRLVRLISFFNIP